MPITNQNSNFMPEKGCIDSLFDRLSRYVCGVEKNWIHSIKPAKQETVELLKKYSKIGEKGYEIPKSYKFFLEHMGEDDGGLLSSYLMADTSITTLCEYYEDESESINPNILVFACFELGDELSFDLRYAQEPKIITSIDGDILSSYSESFEKLLFQSAFFKCEKLRFPNYHTYGGSQNMLKNALEKGQTDNIFDVVDEYARKENFTKAWFSDFRHYIGYRDDAAFMVEMKSGMILDLNGRSEQFVSSFGEKLSLAVGAE